VAVVLPAVAATAALAGGLGTAPAVLAGREAATPEPAAHWIPPVGPPVRVTRAFRAPTSPYGPGHRGVDLAAEPGSAVRAAAAGLVTVAGPVAGVPVVTVQHGDDLRTTYEPVTATVTVGAAVAAGQTIGRLLAGHPGCPVAACLHWGLIRRDAAGDIYLDPLVLLGLGPARLLPAR
jgi:murein DD-endopeptidase MepM/ murein hydrolase activator NlpD